LATEKDLQNKFVGQGDSRGKDVSKIQNAVNKLAKQGLSLESGDLRGLADAGRYDARFTRLQLTCCGRRRALVPFWWISQRAWLLGVYVQAQCKDHPRWKEST
jgi:hypothetical protein